MATTIKIRASESRGTSRRSNKVLESSAVPELWACLQHCNVGLAYVDAQMRLSYCNPAFAALCETLPKKLIGMRLSEAVPFAEEVCEAAERAGLAADGRFKSGRLARAAGGAVGVSLSLCSDPSGSGFIATLLPCDSPDPLPLESSAVPPSRRPPVAAEGRDYFLAVLEHELRNPLAPILAWTEVLKQEPNPTGHMRRAVSAIERSVLQQRALVDDLLDLATIHSGDLRCEQLPVNIQGVLSESVAHFEIKARERGVHLVFESPGSDAMVLGDRRRLAQIFDNLLDNAVKFTPSGGRVEARMTCEPERLRIDLADTGIGIAPDFMSELFKIFTQGHALASRYRRGLGLGLALVKNLVERHRGEVQAASAGENLGATFSVFLPLHTPDAAGVANEFPDSRRKILIVEDRDDTREAMRTLLESWDFQVAEAVDGVTGLKMVAEFAPDLVLCDISMPVMDGWEMARKLRASVTASRIPMIAMSGHGTPNDIQHSLDAGFQAHIVKPCEARTLLEVLNRFVPVSARLAGDLP